MPPVTPPRPVVPVVVAPAVVVVPVIVLVVVLLTPMPTGPGPIPALVELVFVTVEFKDSANKPMPLPAHVRPSAAA
jgi:hypothetical protein